MSNRKVPEKFLVSFSFAGEQREIVLQVAKALEKLLGENTVFYDELYDFLIAGDNALSELQQIFGKRSVLVVPCISEHYDRKPWTVAEFKAINDLQFRLGGSKDRKDSFRILPLRVGDGDVPGILESTICPDIRNMPVEKTVKLVVDRLKLIIPDLPLATETFEPPPEIKQPRYVYLAETPSDMDEPREQMQTFLQSLGWVVLPAAEYTPENYDAALEADLRLSEAFIQLLGPLRWKHVDYVERQNAAAEDFQLPRFRYRDPKIDLKSIDEKQRVLLEDPTIDPRNLDEIQSSLGVKMAELKRLPRVIRNGSRSNWTTKNTAADGSDPEEAMETTMDRTVFFQWLTKLVGKSKTCWDTTWGLEGDDPEGEIKQAYEEYRSAIQRRAKNPNFRYREIFGGSETKYKEAAAKSGEFKKKNWLVRKYDCFSGIPMLDILVFDKQHVVLSKVGDNTNADQNDNWNHVWIRSMELGEIMDKYLWLVWGQDEKPAEWPHAHK